MSERSRGVVTKDVVLGIVNHCVVTKGVVAIARSERSRDIVIEDVVAAVWIQQAGAPTRFDQVSDRYPIAEIAGVMSVLL